MPKKTKIPCKYPGCPNLVEVGIGYCEMHRKPERETAEKRGYGYKWRKIRAMYLRRNPMCVICMREGKFVPATVVDHIIPHRNNPVLMWDENNFQALCKPCHDKKTGHEDSNPTYHY